MLKRLCNALLPVFAIYPVARGRRRLCEAIRQTRASRGLCPVCGYDRCPECGTLYPRTRIEGIGPEAIRCANCGAENTAASYWFRNDRTKDQARRCAREQSK